MDVTANLNLPFIAPAQAQKHVTHNEAIRMLDAVVQAGVADRALASPPDDPAEGARYIIPPGADGDWAGRDHALAVWQDGAWAFYAPRPGWLVWVESEAALAVWDGAAWIDAAPQASGDVSGAVTPASLGDGSHGLVGVNGAAADAVNRLSVRTPAVLFDALDAGEGGDGDCRVVVNKEAPGDTASHLFQSGFSGRAEFGLTGDDNFHLKVSGDGAVWTDALVIDAASGNVGVGGAPDRALHVHSSNPAVRFQDAGAPASFAEFSCGNANFVFRADQNDAVAGSTIFFQTDAANRMRITEGVYVGSPVGGDKGAGSINAHAIYDDNTLLSCYVFDQALDGAIDMRKWDDKVPDRTIEEAEDASRAGQRVPRRHDPARRFAARIGAAHDPLTLDGYARHWKEKRHLTAMPNEAAFDPQAGLAAGEWIQRLVETVEIHAVLIEALNQRTRTIEDKGEGIGEDMGAA